MNSLSILIPTYNTVCTNLVKKLQSQCEEEARHGLVYEIIVADDGSTDISTVNANKYIDDIPNCLYITRCENTGRAAIRNYLARQARHEWLLFIDSHMTVHNREYIARYVNMNTRGVIYGGYDVVGDEHSLRSNLRYIYEKNYKNNRNAQMREKDPYKDFHTSNFSVERRIMLAHPFDELFRLYGYEDVLWGKVLMQENIKITHTDNTLTFDKFETNSAFISKTEEAMHTLAMFTDRLRGYSRLISMADILEKYRMIDFMALSYHTLGRIIKHNLTGNKPRLFWFNIYRLTLYCYIRTRKEQV